MSVLSRPSVRLRRAAVTAVLVVGTGAGGFAAALPASASTPSLNLSPTTTAASTAACAPVQIVAARGTMEPGTLGTLLGPLSTAVQQKLPGLINSFGVPYDAGADYPISTA